MSVWTLEWFRRRWNRSGSMSRAAGRASYAAYLVHAPVVVVLSVALRWVAVPVEIKFVVVFFAGVPAASTLGMAGDALSRSRARDLRLPGAAGGSILRPRRGVVTSSAGQMRDERRAAQPARRA